MRRTVCREEVIMQWSSTQVARWRLVLSGMIAGPALLVVSCLFVAPDGEGGMRAAFEAITAQPWLVLVPSILEAVGFAIALASYAAVIQVVRGRGGALATTGAVLCVLGIVGFAWSAAGGMFLSVLASMEDTDAGFAAATALMADPVTGTILMVLMFAGEAGICLVLIGLLRARLIRFWPLVLVVAGIIADNVVPGNWSGLVADLFLLAASVWTVIVLARGIRYFLSLPSVSPESAAMNAS